MTCKCNKKLEKRQLKEHAVSVTGKEGWVCGARPTEATELHTARMQLYKPAGHHTVADPSSKARQAGSWLLEAFLGLCSFPCWCLPGLFYILKSGFSPFHYLVGVCAVCVPQYKCGGQRGTVGGSQFFLGLQLRLAAQAASTHGCRSIPEACSSLLLTVSMHSHGG